MSEALSPGPDGEMTAHQYLKMQRDFGRFLAIAFRLCRDREDAQDLLQEALARVLKNPTETRYPGQWYNTIARTLFNLQATATTKRRLNFVDNDPENEHVQSEVEAAQSLTASPIPLPEDAQLENERNKALRKAVMSLPETHREVVWLSLTLVPGTDRMGMKQGEIAKKLGMPIEKVKWLRRTGLPMLRRTVLGDNDILGDNGGSEA